MNDDHATFAYSGLRSLASLLQEQEEREAQRMQATRSGFTGEELDRIIQMAWEDRTPFEAIATQFQLKEKDVNEVMHSHLQPSSFRLWRRRMKARRTKHAMRRAATVVRFRSRQQRDTGNRAAKR